MIADLHCHSDCSDGDQTPSELAEIALAAGAEAFSLTDHDTAMGLSEAAAAAKVAGVGFVSGLEISSYDDCNVHVLCYNADFTCPEMKAFEERVAVERRERAEKIVKRFKDNGIELYMPTVLSFCKYSLSRLHIAKAVVAAGYETDIKEVFHKWLGEGGPCYVPNETLTPVEAVRFIRRVGGVAVLAHPVRLKKDLQGIEKLVVKLKDNGLEGIEASYRSYETENEPFYKMAKKYSLFVTNGGDFHSLNRSPMMPKELSDECVEKLFKK